MQSKAIAISQSRYIPWLGYMDRIAKVDLFVILDCVQLDHRCYEKRTKIKTNNGEQWLTIPVLKTARNSPMHEAEVSESTDWRNTHWETLRRAYGRSPNWGKYSGEIFELYKRSRDFKKLIDINQLFMDWLIAKFDIHTPIIKASAGICEGKGGELLKNICLANQATEYVSGTNGRDYIDDAMFADANIKLTFMGYNHPTYEQQFGEFISGLSAIDYLLNSGAKL